MPLIDALLAVVFCILFFLTVSGIALFITSRQSPCEGCDYYVKDSKQCLFNPIYGKPIPKQCQREAWDI